MLIIRDITFLDILSVLSLAKEFYEESEHASCLGFDAEQLCDNLLNIINCEDFHSIVAIKDNELVGFLLGASVREIWSVSNIGYVNLIYVDKKHRDFSTASKLLNSFESWCESREEEIGFMQVGLHSGIQDNLPAEAFLKRKKYKQIGKEFIKET